MTHPNPLFETDLKTALSNATAWLDAGRFDADTIRATQQLITQAQQGQQDQQEEREALINAFSKPLEFGTGGVRAKMGVGTNAVNRYTLSLISQGVANYLRQHAPANAPLKAVIAYDSRHHSADFAADTAAVFLGNGLSTFLFAAPRPTPTLSFAVRTLKAQVGIVITASHNPKEYNGYKVYLEDGAQVTPPRDAEIIAAVRQVASLDEVKRAPSLAGVEWLKEDLDQHFLAAVAKTQLAPRLISTGRLSLTAFQEAKQSLKIVYTSLHGNGITLIPRCLKDWGFEKVFIVEAQREMDGNFPTVTTPNPEETEALQLGFAAMEKQNADLLLATDPDTDRVGVAVRKADGTLVRLSGNQVGSLLAQVVLENSATFLSGKEFLVKTIVTSPLIGAISAAFELPCHQVLTGFKYIAELIAKYEDREATGRMLLGLEESCGYLLGSYVRDKDGVGAVATVAEVAALLKTQGLTPWEKLIEIYLRYGYYAERLVSLVKEGQKGSAEIAALMQRYRSQLPKALAGVAVRVTRDYWERREVDCTTGAERTLTLPQSNVLQFVLEDESVVTVRPSGTEPKIKFYFSVREGFERREDLVAAQAKAEAKLTRLQTHFMEK